MSDTTMTRYGAGEATLPALDEETRALVRLAAVASGGTEAQVREALTVAARVVRPVWVEEVLLQTYLFAGFPRALNAMREWRRISGRRAEPEDEGERFTHTPLWELRGADTCATVYGRFYDRLRDNIRGLHPALDAWMIVEGYGKVLSREGLDLKRRELCVVAACALARQDRQLHSHLHGAVHTGSSESEILDTLDTIADLLGPADLARYRHLLSKVLSQ